MTAPGNTSSVSSEGALRESLAAYENWHSGLPVDADGGSPWHHLVRRHLSPERDLRGRRVLEIGCGRGGFACWLTSQPDRPEELVAADFSPVAVEKAREFAQLHHVEGVTWETADIQRLPYADQSFDTVISCETIEHVPDPIAAVTELARVLKTGGRLYLTTPNYLGPLGAYRAYYRLKGKRYTEGGQPINHFTMLPRTCRWVRRTGLRLCRVDASGHYLPLPGGLVEAPWLGRPHAVMKWFAHHSLLVATRAR